MANFFVGQRVRLIYSDNEALQYPIGTETRIMSVSMNITGVRYWELDLAHPLGGRWRCPVAEADQRLAPIQDPGHQVTTWDKCIWKPEQGIPA